MHSWDLFDTLIAARDARPAGDASPEEWIPIAENIARVQPEDIIISEYYLDQKAKAEAAVALTGLKNRLYVTDRGKSDGTIWSQVATAKHHGDNPATDVASPRACGIPAEHITTSGFTRAEQYIAQLGLPEVATACREARLRTWHPKFRALQLLQIEGNFPLLLVASIALNHFAKEHQAKKVLMAARDCCLWVGLQQEIRDRLYPFYDVEYWPSSRFCRNKPTADYLKEFNHLLEQGAVLVDVGGTGKSIVRLLEKSSRPDTPVMLVVKYDWTDRDGFPPIDTTKIVSLLSVGDAILEDVNVPAHGIYLDWSTVDDLNFDWGCEEVCVSHAAFKVAREAFAHQPIPAMVNVNMLAQLFQQIRPNVGKNLDFLKPALLRENAIRVSQAAGL